MDAIDTFERRRLILLKDFILDLATGADIYFRPARKRVELNDKATKKIFSLPTDIFNTMLRDNAIATIQEAKIKGKALNSTFRMIVDRLDDLKAQLSRIDEFDRAILAAYVSELDVDNKYCTIDSIYRNMVGKVAEPNVKPSKQQSERILASIEKMSLIRITLDYTSCRVGLKQFEPFDTFIFTGYIMPCNILKGKINGKPAALIQFLDKSPLYTIAAAKRQLLTYDASLLNVPHVNFTPMNTAVLTYTARRIMEIRQHYRQMKPTITFADVFEHCDLADADNKTKLRAREIMIALFEHFADNGLVEKFNLTKERGVFHSIKFI